jgi:uncharacterized protein
MDLGKFKKDAEANLEANKKFLKKLKKSKPKHLDALVQQLHDEVFAYTDCLKCANCCKTTSPIFQMGDIERVAKALKMKTGVFIDMYLQVDEDGDYVLNSAPCPFLLLDNMCMVYENRPTACREYPHTDRKRFHQILDLTLRNTEVCPAVLDVVEQLKAKI